MSSGAAAVRQPRHRDIGDLVQEHRALIEPGQFLAQAVVRRVGAQPVEHLALGRERRRAQARQHAEELGLVLVRVAGRERHCDDAAENAGPERVDERREAVDQDDGFGSRRGARRPAGAATSRARVRAARRTARGARWPRRRCNATARALPGKGVEGVGKGGECGHRVGRGFHVQGAAFGARKRTCIDSGWRVRRFTCGSISTRCPSASESSNRRASITDVRVHLDLRQVFADARARTQSERKIHKTIARCTRFRQEAVRIEAIGRGPVVRMTLHHVRRNEHVGAGGQREAADRGAARSSGA